MAQSRTTSEAARFSTPAASVVRDGWVVAPCDLDPSLLDRVAYETADHHSAAGVRNLLDISASARLLARHPSVRAIPEAILGAHCFVTRAILFDKTPDSNWKVPWHQDLAIAVAERREVSGFGPWSTKEGVTHVQPPADVLGSMVTIRVHLDPCGIDNGPVRVLPGTHLRGKLSPSDIENAKATIPEAVCIADRGHILAFRPLLLHASSAATTPRHRRVAHFEFAAVDLPYGLQWALRWS